MGATDYRGRAGNVRLAPIAPEVQITERTEYNTLVMLDGSTRAGHFSFVRLTGSLGYAAQVVIRDLSTGQVYLLHAVQGLRP